MEQSRARDVQGATEMYAEIEILGLTLPVHVDEGGMISLREMDSMFPVDRMIADAARTCYQTNHRASEEKDCKLIQDVLLKLGHLSVGEHAKVVIRVRGASRAFTHQLVRHRHTAYSQESQRYCDEGNFGYIVPPRIKEAGLTDWYLEMIEQARRNYLECQHRLQEAGFGKSNEDARFLLPNAVASEIVIGVNFTELRHMFIKRLTTHAQWEIRDVFSLILEEMKKLTTFFDDIYDYYHKNGNLNGFSAES
jgi:thymidylate synthase (FAD)